MKPNRYLIAIVAGAVSFTAVGAAHHCQAPEAPPYVRDDPHIEVGSSSMTNVPHAITLAEVRAMVASYTNTSRSA